MYFDNFATKELEAQFERLNYEFHVILRYDRNIVNEIMMYFKVFELDSACVKDIPGIKHIYSEEHILSILKDFKEEMPSVYLDLVPIYSGGKVYEAADWLLSRTVHHDVAMRKKPTLSEAQFQTQWTEQPSFRPSNESVIEMMSLGFTKEQAIDVLKCSDGNEEEAAIRLVNHPVHSDVTVQEKVAFFEEEEKIKDSDFVEIQDSDEEKQDSDEEIKELDKDIIADFSESITDLSPGDINGKTSKETINVSCLNRNR
ncbi:unnamed protein product [Mytilus coruscus]|uniref:UBA domain-containing protein n=1 Tax=Mytilus coruscus TaxID=42192 RepID=A0A6J8DA04_MYTCO|nr:unnamed protein product [Mytilus coruscus]